MLRFFCNVKFILFALVLVLGGLCFFWSPLSSNALEWYLANQIERQFGGSFHAEKITWQNGHLVFELPSITTISSKKNEEKQFHADQLIVQYSYSLWDRKIDLKVLMKAPSFKVNSAAAILLQTLLNTTPTFYTFALNWQVSIPDGTLLQRNAKQFPFSLEIEDEEGAKGHFSLQFMSDTSQSQSLSGYFLSEARGKKSIHFDFNQVPLIELAQVLRYFDSPLNKLQITSGSVNGSANILLEKKQIPLVDAELTFTDIIAKQPALDLTSTISKAVFSLPQGLEEKGKFELQGKSHLYIGSGNHLNELQGGIYWENRSNAVIHFHGKWVDGKDPLSFSLDGLVSPLLTEAPLRLGLAFKEFKAALTDLHGNHFSAHFSDDFLFDNNSKLQFSGSSLLATKLLPSAMAAALQKQFDLDRLSLDGLIKKEGSKCTVDTTLKLNDPKNPLQETLIIAFDLENAQKFYSKKTPIFPFESYCCDIYLAATIFLKPSSVGHYGISLNVEALNARVSDVQQLLSHFDRFALLTALPLQGNIALGKKKNCLEFMFTPEGCKIQPTFSGSLSEGKFNGARQDLTFDDFAFDFSYDHDAKTLFFKNLQGALFLGTADNTEEYSFAGHSISFSDLRKLQATFDISLTGNEGNLFRLAGHTEAKTKEKEGKPLSVFFDKDRSHINGMSLSRLDLTLNEALHIEHFHLEFPIRLQKLIAGVKLLSKTKVWRDLGIGDIQEIPLENSDGSLQVEMKYDQKSDIFVFNVKGSDLTLNSHKIEKCLLHGKKRGNLWSIEQLKIDKFSIAADLVKENQKWIFNFLGLRWGSVLLMGLKGDYFADRQTFKGDIDLLEMDLKALQNIPKLHSLVSHLQPQGQFKAVGKLLLVPKGETNFSLNFSITEPNLMGLSLGEIQNASCELNTGKSLTFKLEIPHRGLFIDLAKSNDNSLKTNAPFLGTISVDFGQFTEFMPFKFQKKMSEWKIRNKLNFTGQWNLNQKYNPTDGYFSFKGAIKGENIEFKGYELELLQANCTCTTNKVVLNNLIIQDPAGTLQIDHLTGVHENHKSWKVSAGTCRITNWRPNVMREVSKKPFEKDTSLVISRLIIDRFQGIVGKTSSFKGMGEFHFSQQSTRTSNNPLFAVPMEMINRIGLDLSILSPHSGNVFFEILDDKIFLTKLKDVYSDGKLSKFNLTSRNSSFIDFDGNLNLQIRLKHYSLFFKLAELFTLNVTGTVQKPIYSFKKQPRKASRK